MAIQAFQHSLRGVLGFPVSPFRKDLSLDPEGLERNVAAMARHPFCALVVAGGAGEIYSLTPAEIETVVRVSVAAAEGRMPVLAGVGFGAAIAAELARCSEEAGATGLLVLPPYYVNAPEGGLMDYYRAVAEASGLPLMLYSRDWTVFTPDAVARLADGIPNLAAWKEGQGDLRRLQRLIARLGERLVWIGGAGDDFVASYYAVGVQAFTSSLSNIAPRLSLALAAAGMSRDFVRLEELLKRYVHPLFAIRDRSRGYEVAVTKRAMEILGLPAGPVRPPLSDCGPEEVAAIGRVLESYAEFLD